MPPAPSPNGSPAHTRRIVASCRSNRRPRVRMSASPAMKSSARPPTPKPSVRRPPESASTLAACLASIAPLRNGASRTLVISRTREVTAEAAANVVSGS